MHLPARRVAEGQLRDDQAGTQLESAGSSSWNRRASSWIATKDCTGPEYSSSATSSSGRVASKDAGKTPFKVADLSLAEFGRKEIRLAEHEMPGLMALRKEYKAKRHTRDA